MKKFQIEDFDNTYFYDKDDLGYTVKEDVYTFKVWTPLADELYLCIYDKYNENSKVRYKMNNENNKGLWEIKLKEDLEGKYYTFIISIDGGIKEAVDPYAKALSVNGEKGAIINLEKTNPKGWGKQKVPVLNSYTDAVIYELNIRDLSIDKNSGIKNKGKYLGLAEENTESIDEIKTGLAHIKDLGVTHIQLLPIFDFGSIDESAINNEGEFKNSRNYNWGYDPVNYNAPEGSYSLDPFNPTSRINELKLAIKTIHDNGLGVIMDVVYNHMYEVEKSSFHKLVPGYYFRYDENNALVDESMCGNVIASENSMVRKFIVDSVKFWAEEYKIDGFRFDLMGLIDTETISEVKKELYKINPSVIILGEGWDMGKTLKEEEKAIQKNAYKLENVAFFNDSIRDSLRGSVFLHNAKGFLTGEENLETEIKKSIVGGINYSKEINLWGEVSPNQVVNYIECHDNHTLFDKLKLVCDDDNKVKYMHRLGTSIVLLSQGVPFIHAGQEFLRTKNGVENSYNSNDSINKLDWNRKKDNIDSVNYIKGLIKLRKEHPAFRMNTVEEIKTNISFIDTPKNSIAYLIKNNANGDIFKEILVIHNANEEEINLNLSSNGSWQVIVNKDIVNINGIEFINGDCIVVKELSTLVAVIK